MNRTKIPWADYTVNPVKGLCPMACKDNVGKEYCYARRMYKRFKWNPEITYTSRWNSELPWVKPSKIFVGSTMELFGDWIPDEWLEDIFLKVKLDSQHTFIFLTKQPQNAMEFMGWQSDYLHHRRPAHKLPDNVWMGVSITNHLDAPKARDFLLEGMARVNFLSIEPLLGHFDGWSLANVVREADWLIIGCQTPMSAKTLPKKEWVDEIIEAADKASIPVFVKEPMASHFNIQRQEFPHGR